MVEICKKNKKGKEKKEKENKKKSKTLGPLFYLLGIGLGRSAMPIISWL
jgi:hypothetical protein